MRTILIFSILLNQIILLGQCEEGEYPISISTTSGNWAYEMSWGLWDHNTWMNETVDPNNSIAYFQGQNNYETVIFEGCITNEGCYIIQGYDSYGDGWNLSLIHI